MVQQFLALVPVHQQGSLHAPWVDRFEAGLVDFLHMHQPGDEFGLELPEASPFEDLRQRAGRARLEQLKDRVLHQLAAPLTLAEMARLAGVSTRTLNNLCRDLCHTTPMQFLRTIRLDAARERILGVHDCSVTEAALECGFVHLGRFSAYYSDRFGESPAQTRLRSMAGRA